MCARHFGLSLCVNRIFNVEHNNMWGHSTNFSRIYHPTKFKMNRAALNLFDFFFDESNEKKTKLSTFVGFVIYFSSKPLEYSYKEPFELYTI